jgi:serine phosphatase RsbU (regulator of sigma subunit)
MMCRSFLPLLILIGSVACAETPAQGAPAGIEVRVADSTARLGGPWKFEPGDSPWSGNAFVWASPAYDDSGWHDMDLHAAQRQIDPGYGDPEYLKGWTSLGFPNLEGFAWYRIRLHIANPAQSLALKMPDHLDDAYQVYANGKYVGEFGNFTAKGVECFRSRALTFALPRPDDHGDLLLAIRFYMEPFVLVGGTTGDSGGMHQAPLIGTPAEMERIRAEEHTGRILGVIVSVFVSGLLLIAAGGAFWIWLIDRLKRTFLWLTLGLLLASTPALANVVAFFTYVWTQGMLSQVAATLSMAGLVCWILFWRDWFELQGSWVRWWIPAAVAAFGSLVQFSILFDTHMPLWMIVAGMTARAVAKAALGLLVFAVLYEGARQDRVGALLALPPIVLLFISSFGQELITWAHIRTTVFPYGIQVAVSDVALVLLVLVTGALAVRRFIGSQVSQRLERQSIDQELEQARELQQRVLIPEKSQSPLFDVETAYYPARTVGGDFFQVISYPDGSLLVVVGDVSGKGMAAAMLVAVLVGAVRTRADETADPGEILHTLNERLLGRAGGHFATCVAAHFKCNGQVTIANAGHLPPYHNGAAIESAGAIPLGLVAGSGFEVKTIKLAPEDTMTFLTDGVLEARNQHGSMLGFDETAKLAGQPAETIARAAILHGQDDDITVVSVRACGASAEPAKALEVESSPA